MCSTNNNTVGLLKSNYYYYSFIFIVVIIIIIKCMSFIHVVFIHSYWSTLFLYLINLKEK
jgi:hypothetical protein